MTIKLNLDVKRLYDWQYETYTMSMHEFASILQNLQKFDNPDGIITLEQVEQVLLPDDYLTFIEWMKIPFLERKFVSVSTDTGQVIDISLYKLNKNYYEQADPHYIGSHELLNSCADGFSTRDESRRNVFETWLEMHLRKN